MLFIGLRLYGVLVFVQKEAGIPKKIIKIEDIPGLSKFLNVMLTLYQLLPVFCDTWYIPFGNYMI
jgi:hypothetical protein